jgi:DNA-binding transcriptional regulator YiaG
LGIAGRTSHVKFAVKLRKSNQPKPLPANIQSIGDLIQARRQAKNLTTGHVALKMGIAASVVCSWEDGGTQPNEWQLALLVKVLGFDPSDFKTRVEDLIFPAPRE